MQTFTEYKKEYKAALNEASSRDLASKFNKLYESKLKELGANSPLDLNESQKEEFFSYIKSLDSNEDLNEGKITDAKSFKEYAMTVLKKAHGKDFNEDEAKKTIKDLVDEVNASDSKDWGEAIGKLTSGFGS